MKRLFASIAVVMLTLAGGAVLAQSDINQHQPGDAPGKIGEVGGATSLQSHKLGNEGPQPANRDAVNVPGADDAPQSGSSAEKSTPTAPVSYGAKVDACRTEGEHRQNLSGNALQSFVAKCVGE